MLCKPVRDLINNNADYIENNDFLYIYNQLHFDVLAKRWEPEYTGEFTMALIEADINPLDSMGIVPGYYLCGDTLTTGMFLPKHIHKVEQCAFQDSSLEEIDFGENTTRIEQCVCSGCNHLWRVVMHNKLEALNRELFYGCNELKEITFKGTKQEWYRIKKDQRWRNGAPNLSYVVCDDGEIELK